MASKEQDDAVPAMPPEFVTKHQELQARELALKERELELSAQKDLHQYQLALKSMEHQAQAGNDFRQKAVENWKSGRNFLLLAFIIACVFLGFALWLDKEQTVESILKYVFLLLGGGGIGYGYATSKKDQNPPPPQPPME